MHVMEFFSKLRWVIVVLALLLVLSIAGWGLAAIARNLVGSGTGTSEGSDLIEYTASDARVVRYSVVGPVVASSEHRSYTIEASRNVVIMRLYSDYGQKVIDERTYQNDERSFEYLIEALENYNASARLPGTTEEDDYKDVGACPAGRVHMIELDDEVRRWRTNCETVPGTAGGDMAAIRKLFSEQIPDFKQIIKGTKLI